MATSMKARLQDLPRETAMVVERAYRVIGESRRLLEQRENQLRQVERFLQRNPLLDEKLNQAN